ncbi:hypothetical protein I5J49_gp54 [Mycobacterium phage ThulaThula]|uniref:Uncharacterized protein n=1 Tax=Mycobacterium phage ThulaThula TaxID=2599880 RepID=A0A5J6TJR5_9CAUD|nr:hypothetical protein I5J49_gp54 [Mycobacterium phage ThulaThula]QFG09082.1 hypothetical protein PBI_THULATHULA_54 [Mycobacterium phage ThulaThula]
MSAAVNREAVVDLVLNAIGYGVMMALEGRAELVARLQAAPPSASLGDLLRGDAERFAQTRADLVEALEAQP